MNKTNPQVSQENETQEPVYLEIWCRVRAYKIENSTFESCSIVRYNKKNRITITLCSSV